MIRNTGFTFYTFDEHGKDYKISRHRIIFTKGLYIKHEYIGQYSKENVGGMFIYKNTKPIIDRRMHATFRQIFFRAIT